MLAAFSFIELAQGFGLLAILAFAPVFVFKPKHPRPELDGNAVAAGTVGRSAAAKDGVAAALQAVGIAVLVLTAMDATGAWRWLWKSNGYLDLNRVVFPDLNGEWHGVLLSNGKLRNPDLNLPQPDPKADCSVFGIPRTEDFACIRVSVTIEMSLFDTQLTLVSGNLISHTKAVWLKRRGGGEDARILYIYGVANPGSRTPDDRYFNGGAELRFVQKDWMLEGGYWSDRNWANGQNTAGRIKLTRAGSS